MSRSNSPGVRLLVPLNIMCSKKCARPVIPGTSLRLPARTQLYMAMLGISRSVQMMTFMPLASVVECTCSMPGTRVAGAGFAAAAQATAARPNEINPAQSARTLAAMDAFLVKKGSKEGASL